MPPPTIIALAGPKTVGKSTIAAELAHRVNSDEHFTEARVYSFADPMRAMLRAMGVGEHYFQTGMKEAEIDWLPGHSVRSLLLSLGTDWGRGQVTPEVWLRALHRRILGDAAAMQGDPSTHLVAIIDDCRFPNEAQYIWEQGGKVIELSREGIAYTGGHATEKGLPYEYLDATFNAGDIEKCASQIYDLYVA